MIKKLIQLLSQLHANSHLSAEYQQALNQLDALKREFLNEEEKIHLDSLLNHIFLRKSGKVTTPAAPNATLPVEAPPPLPVAPAEPACYTATELNATATHPQGVTPEEAAKIEFEAGVNLAKMGKALPYLATDSAKAGFASVANVPAGTPAAPSTPAADMPTAHQ